MRAWRNSGYDKDRSTGTESDSRNAGGADREIIDCGDADGNKDTIKEEQMWVHFLLSALLTALQSTVKNPKSIAKERAALGQIQDLLGQIIQGIDAK